MVVTMCVVSGLHRTGRWPGGVPPLRCGRLAPMLAVACALLGEGALRPALGVMVTNPTTYWSPVAPLGDLVADRQTGGDEVDLVGNAGTPSFYMAFDGGGTPLLTDGTLAFRARLAGEQTPAGFSSVLFVGMDADLNGDIDLYLGVGQFGSKGLIEIFGPGSNTNVSPSTTSIAAYKPAQSYTLTASNYNWSPVTLSLDPTAATLDFGGTGGNDYFLSFAVPFADIVARLATQGIAVTEDTSMRYVMATSMQGNALNADLNGVGKNYDGNATWEDLGGFSDPMAPGTLVPEPGSAMLLAAAGVLVMRRRRRRA